MIFHNILMQILVFSAFALLYILIPFFCMGLKFNYKDFIYNILSSLTVGAFFIIQLMFILSALNQINPLFFYISLLICAFGLTWLFYREREKKRLDAIMEYFYLQMKGVYKWELTVKGFFLNIRKAILEFLLDMVKNPLRTLGFLIGIAGAVYVRCHNQIVEMHFGTSDLYVHADWVAQMIGGRIFANGVYPFGMHNMIVALHEFSGINHILLVQFYGGITGLFIVVSLYLLLRRLFRSDLAVLCGFLFYTLSRIIDQLAYERQSFALPQESGMIFMLLSGIFFIDYIRMKKRRDLIFLIMAFSLTISCHFYITIFTVMLLGSIFLVHIKDIIVNKLFLRLVIAIVISFSFAIVPLVAYNLSGIQWEHSLSWAANLMAGKGYSEAEQNQVKEEANEQPSLISELAKEEGGFFRKVGAAYNYAAGTFGRDQRNTEERRFWVFTYFLVMTAIMVIGSFLLVFLKKEVEYAKFLLSMGLYSGLIFILIFAHMFGLFSLFEEHRLLIFYCYNMGFLAGILAELISAPFIYIEVLKKPEIALRYIAAPVYIWFVLSMGIQYPGRAIQSQYNSAVMAYYKIAESFKKLEWTIVSSVDELCMTRNLGWHYELNHLVYELAEGDEATQIFIPSNDVFFFIEKRPITCYRVNDEIEPNFKFPPEESVSIELAMTSIEEVKERLILQSDVYTKPENRRVIMSKAYYWMQEYKKYFPNEITVYYEDDDFVVYHLSQMDPYALNNLYIDYGYNF